LYVAVREQEGREASPTAAIIDSQTARGAQKGGLCSILQATTRARRSKVASGTSWSTHLHCPSGVARKSVVTAVISIGSKAPRHAQCLSVPATSARMAVSGSRFLGHLKALPVKFPVAAPPVNIVTLKQRALSPVAKMFVDFVRKQANSAAYAGRPRRLLSRP